MQPGWHWTGTENVNLPALVICLLVIAFCYALVLFWISKPQSRRRGIITLLILLTPTILSAAALVMRVTRF
jgi:hypothetical protein